VTGWGAEHFLGDVPLDMRNQSLTTVPSFVCETIFSTLNITLPEDMALCAQNSTDSDIAPCTVSKLDMLYIEKIIYLHQYSLLT